MSIAASPPPRGRAGPGQGRAWLLAGAGAVLAWSLLRALADGRDLVNPGGWPQLRAFLAAALQPDLSPAMLALAARSAVTTLAYAVAGAGLSLLLGLLLGLPASAAWWEGRRLPRGWLVLRGVLVAPRAIHEVIWGLLLVNILGLSPLSAILAIALPFGAITARVYADILDAAPTAPRRALLVAGATPTTAFVYGLLPRSLPQLVSYAFYRLECALRSAAVLGVIGAGGLGQELLTSFQSLRYREMWTFIAAQVLLSGAVDFWSGRVREHLGLAGRLALNLPAETHGAAGPGAAAARRPLRLQALSALALLLGLPLSLAYLGAHPADLWSERSRRLGLRFLSEVWPPNLSGDLWAQLLRHSLDTAALAVLAIAMAALLGALLSFPAARNLTAVDGILSRGRPGPWRRRIGVLVLGGSRAGLLLLRAVPPSVWAVACLFVFFPGILPGALALGLYTTGVLGRLMAEAVEAADDRPARALTVCGAPAPLVLAYGLVPQVLPGFLSYSLYRWEVCSREAVIVGVVGAAGLGRVLAQQLAGFDHPAVAATMLAYLLLTVFVDLLGSAARLVLPKA